MGCETWRESLAWAAGLFDGEGHTGCRIRRSPGRFSRPIYATISQHHREVLEDFQEVVGGLGKIYIVTKKRPARSKLTGTYTSYAWRTNRFEHTQAVIAMIWPFLGSVKKAQAAAAFKLYHENRPSYASRF